MNNGFRASFLAIFALAFSLPAVAATYIVPRDAEMIQKADDIVIATGVSSVSERDARGGIVTRNTLRIEETLKGPRQAGQELVVTELGGVVGDAAKFIAGAPQYQPGVRYLLFTSANRDLEPTTFGMALGQFHLVNGLAVRTGIHGFSQNLDEHVEQVRDAQRFGAYIRAVLGERRAPVDYFIEDVEQQLVAEAKIGTNAFTPTSYLMQSNGRGFRWSSPSAAWVRNGTSTGAADSSSAISVGFGQWNSAGAGIAYSLSGTDASATGGLSRDDAKNAILFGDPNNEIDEATGVAGIGGISNASSGKVDGIDYWLTREADLVMAAISFSQGCMNVVMTHELGHTLGFRHSNSAEGGTTCGSTAECTSDAIMNASVTCSVASNLRPYDINAANSVYGSNTAPACTPPSITTQPLSKNLALGATTSLSVVAAGTAPLAYAWFIGNTGDTSSAVPGGNTATINVSPTTTTTYWVRVTNACSTQVANSVAATVTVSCAAPAITTPPASIGITAGAQATLQVVATGSGLSYQWYLGTAGDTRQPTGVNSATLNVAPLVTTQYWVRVSGSCGAPADSPNATVTVTPCADLEVEMPTATQNPGIGNFRLNVNAFSTATPLQFQWFRGITPGVGGTLIGSGQAINVTVTAATSFWARVTNSCGRTVVSNIITVAPCTLPAISTQPEDRNIVTGTAATLSIGVATTATTVTWYRGAIGERSTSVGTGASVNVSPTETTQYWAELTNTCGAVSSRAVTVTVEQATTNLFLLNRRFNVQVRYRNQFANPPAEGLLTGRSLQASALSDTAIFWFDSPLVVELMVRVSDARPFDNAFHVYFGGLSDVEFFITVKDTLTGKTVEYHKLPSQLTGQIDRKSFPAAANGTVLDEGLEALMERASRPMLGANADTTTLRMMSRYDVRIRYRNQFAQPIAEGYLLGRAITKIPTTETAVFYFENPESVEWMVRFSDVRPFANRVDFFPGGLSDVEYTVEVTDSVTGKVKSYPV
ncbi:MAG TPA: M57 family metalloprotease, partial [Thermoanaerobaculia bacterium]|nr:M57 family metalloprotease [Thermoanaerobaculia bacterium]